MNPLKNTQYEHLVDKGNEDLARKVNEIVNWINSHQPEEELPIGNGKPEECCIKCIEANPDNTYYCDDENCTCHQPEVKEDWWKGTHTAHQSEVKEECCMDGCGNINCKHCGQPEDKQKERIIRDKTNSKYWDTMVNILDNCFPKGECKERGKALVMLAYIEMLLKGAKFNEDGELIKYE